MPKQSKDVERGETCPLLGADRKFLEQLGSVRGENKRGGLATLPSVPVGGHPGNVMFYTQVQLAVRCTVMLLLIGSMIWRPETTKILGMSRFAQHAGLAGCLMVFFSTYTVGGVLNTASAGITGCFMACLNIFFLRGFFPDGVEPGMGFTSAPSLAGWLNLALYNLAVLGFNCRMGFRMTAMALNVGFMLCFLNPADHTVFSKNFKINPNGAAVSAFIGVCLGSLCATLAVCLPWPLGLATTNMKKNGREASQDMCKLFIAATKYFKEEEPSVLIERQIGQSELLRKQIDGLTASINDAYAESLDFATQGTIRGLYEEHASMLGEMFDILTALQYAMATEDFGPSHIDCMEAIGEQAHDLVDAASMVLITATIASEDGDIDLSEQEDLEEREKTVQLCMMQLSMAFDDMRKKFGKPVCKELMNESFFVFCICGFARKSIEYSTLLRTEPPVGKALAGEVYHNIRDLATIPMWYHFRVVSRYWLSLMLCFMFSVYMDNFVPSCAITGVFLINTRVGPDVLAMIQGLLAVVVGIVANALMYSFSCRFGSTDTLMIVATLYWTATLTVAKGSSSLANIGLLMAALSPFALFKFCEPDSPEVQAAAAIGLWTGIRALLIAVVITVIAEVMHVPGLFSQLSRNALEEAFEAMQKAFTNVFADTNTKMAKKNVDAALDEVAKKVADVETYNTACLMEPRLWKCPWKGQFVLETAANLKKIRLDVLLIKSALCGLDGKMDKMIDLLNKVPEMAHMKKDLDSTLEDARELAIELLDHDNGKFRGLEKLETVEGLDDLDGYEDAIAGQCKVVSFPEKAPENMEEDQCVRLSIVYVMLAYLVKHTTTILKSGVKLA